MREVTCTEVLNADASAQVIDVRESNELHTGMVAVAAHLPMSEMTARLGELDLNRRVIAVCRSGARSAKVAEALTAAGFECDTMGGGMIEWSAQGLPVSVP